MLAGVTVGLRCQACQIKARGRELRVCAGWALSIEVRDLGRPGWTGPCR